MPWYAIALIIYGVLCLFIGLMKPPVIWNMGKIKAIEKVMGKVGAQIFILVWGLAALVAGLLLR